MKKLIITAAIVSSMFSSAAFAKDDAVGIAITHVAVNNQYNFQNVHYSTYDLKNQNVSFSLDYTHAFGEQFNKNLVLNGNIFYDYLNNDANNFEGDRIILNHRIGAQVEAGYKFFNKVAPFVTIGLSDSIYGIGWYDNTVRSRNVNSGIDPIYGLGVAYDLNKDNYATVKYNYQAIDLDGPDNQRNDTYYSKIQTIKLGISHKF